MYSLTNSNTNTPLTADAPNPLKNRVTKEFPPWNFVVDNYFKQTFLLLVVLNSRNTKFNFEVCFLIFWFWRLSYPVIFTRGSINLDWIFQPHCIEDCFEKWSSCKRITRNVLTSHSKKWWRSWKEVKPVTLYTE